MNIDVMTTDGKQPFGELLQTLAQSKIDAHRIGLVAKTAKSPRDFSPAELDLAAQLCAIGEIPEVRAITCVIDLAAGEHHDTTLPPLLLLVPRGNPRMSLGLFHDGVLEFVLPDNSPQPRPARRPQPERNFVSDEGYD
ncbi:hypothetical protein A3A40_03395 [Candidatus Kaiserbacteria bacterium RIFCSPLOWO2_01_FULL_54_20]|uniref:Uncharacterized protein n=1 Tax=Candidatus Kaiserbacteria bacterium RIFCSPLOWO2_01_FULL_54_20 TaxID=1798513 RepID=A0A1F6EJ73_9BACT|nr:MAG: hypothetical protein A3A40_03395 [Candidatus Kaiserbacteria bacterium RIFCSPLOWO2_01_FULL_54_20]